MAAMMLWVALTFFHLHVQLYSMTSIASHAGPLMVAMHMATPIGHGAITMGQVIAGGVETFDSLPSVVAVLSLLLHI